MHRMPIMVRRLIKNLGDPVEASDLVSYLLFESTFTSRLIELGFKDAQKQKEEISRFIDF